MRPAPRAAATTRCCHGHRRVDTTPLAPAGRSAQTCSAPTGAFLGGLRVPGRIAAPCRHPTTTATRCCDRDRANAAPTTLRFHAHRANVPTLALDGRLLDPTTATRRRDCDCTNAPSMPTYGGLLAGTAVTACFDDGGSHGVLSGDYGADTATEWDGPLDLEPLGIELPDSDVLVGDVHLPVLVAVSLRPRFGFAGCPGAAIEEQRLDVHRRSSFAGLCDRGLDVRWLAAQRRSARGARGSRAQHRVTPRGRRRCVRRPTTRDVATASRFAEVGQSIVV